MRRNSHAATLQSNLLELHVTFTAGALNFLIY